MTTTIIHKGSERTWEGPYENWMAHKEYIVGWCDGREVLFRDRLLEDNPGFDPSYKYSFKPKEPVVFESYVGLKTLCESLKVPVSTLTFQAPGNLYDDIKPGQKYKITIEEVE